MDVGATCGSVIGRSNKPEKSRRSWTSREEEVLIQSLKDIITKGWKSENGFKAGYLTLLENAMQTAIPGSNLRGNPHINSKIHVWKKTYSTLITILTKSGIGWNDIDNTIDATDETWEALIKSDQSLRTMRHKQWTHYNDWCEIFGNDRATGEHAKNFDHALQDVLKLYSDVPNESLIGDTPTSPFVEVAADSISETHTPASKPCTSASSKRNKRKKITDIDDSIVEAINNLAHITRDTMADLVKQLATEEKISDAQDVVLEAVERIKELSDEEKVVAAQLLFNNHDNLALFKRLGEKGRICLVKRLLSRE